jgi:predicted transcriptional regulator
MLMQLKDIVRNLDLKVFCGADNLQKAITGGYTSDLLSDVMGFANAGQVWITLQTHKNVIAIASLKELAAILLVKGYVPDSDALEQAIEEDIPVLGTDKQAFEISGMLFKVLNSEQ